MNTSQTIATWIGTAATSIGLGSLIAQSSAIGDRLDPFYRVRSREHLGSWADGQQRPKWFQLTKPPPVGPTITALLTHGFCGSNTIRLTRKPTTKVGKASWTALLAVLHPDAGPTQFLRLDDLPHQKAAGSHIEIAELGEIIHDERPSSVEWAGLPSQPLRKYGDTACLTVDRRTFTTLLAIQNSKPNYRYSGSAGHRAAYSNYIGVWYIDWPIGGSAVVRFSAHDSHTDKDPYPLYFVQRVDKCIYMLAGIVEIGDSKTAFPGRKGDGEWVLEFQTRGFNGSHGSRHLYNMLGGKSYEVDRLFRRKVEQSGSLDRTVKLLVPTVGSANVTASLYVRANEVKLLQNALDCLPWTSLSWSLHRGMKDILLAFGKATMQTYRAALATKLKEGIEEHPRVFEQRGWDPTFIRENMPHMAYNTVMAGAGNSGDLVRIVADAALLFWDKGDNELDHTSFWTQLRYGRECEENGTVRDATDLDADAVIALTKYVVMEWSQELDYQMYYELPMELLLA
ncbi:hypothetical protein LTR85_005127 [Meristemomyces frigidus]|nr:hypothetical protein LTR85_005127 [Meristemomyces frigidus]